jgi:hypothetical protein
MAPSCPSCNTALDWGPASTAQQDWIEEEYYYDQEPGADPYQDPYYAQQDFYDYPAAPGRARSPWLLVGGVAAFLLVCVGACCLGLVAAELLLSADVALPFTNKATPTVELEAGSSVPAPSYDEIRIRMGEMSELEWAEYTQSLRGTMAENWSGWVLNVGQTLPDQYEIQIDIDPPGTPQSTYDVSFRTPNSQAMALQPGQALTFSGRIESVENVMGSAQVTMVDAAAAGP